MAAVTRRWAASAHRGALTLGAHSDGGAILARTAGGACIFFDSENGRLCAVHRELGEPMLPSACRQFPRVTLTDPRGRWITLSHFCPTAAALLFSPAPVTIVAAPASIALDGGAEGLDATVTLPPLLRPGMLMDWDGYRAWERGAIDVLCTGGASADDAVASLESKTLAVQDWSPGDETLAACVTRGFGGTFDLNRPTEPACEGADYALALAAVPEGLTIPFPSPVESIDVGRIELIWSEFEAVVRRYLAARLFACWWPYLGLDLRGVLRAIQVHVSVLRTRIGARLALGDRGRAALLEAIREADLLMVHLADGPTLATGIARNQGSGGTGRSHGSGRSQGAGSRVP